MLGLDERSDTTETHRGFTGHFAAGICAGMQGLLTPSQDQTARQINSTITSDETKDAHGEH